MKSQCAVIRKALEAGAVLTARDVDRLCQNKLDWGCVNHKGRMFDLRKAGLDVSCNQFAKVKGHKIGLYYLKSLYSYEEAVELRFPNLARDNTRDSKGRFVSDNNPATIKILDKAEELYKSGKNLRSIAAMFPDTSWRSLYRGLKQRGVLRHRGQQSIEFTTGVKGEWA